MRDMRMRRFTDDEVRAFRASTETNRVLAARAGISRENMRRLRAGLVYKHVKFDPAAHEAVTRDRVLNGARYRDRDKWLAALMAGGPGAPKK